MFNDYVLQAGEFVNFLNEEFSDDLKTTAESHFELRDYRPNFLFGVGRQKIVLNNMYSPPVGRVYRRNIERVADVLHLKGKSKCFSLVNIETEHWERLGIDIAKPIKLGYSKIIEPQKFILHNVFAYEENITYLEQIEGLKQLAYEKGVWKLEK